MARRKTTNRKTSAEIPPPSTWSAQARASHESSLPSGQPPPPLPTSARPSSSRGKRPITEEVHPLPPWSYRGSRISLGDGVTPTHQSLGPVNAQLHCIVTHIILPQNGSYQRVSFCDTLVLFALIMRIKISFAYLMMRHMHDCIKGDRNSALPCGMFLTKVFEAYFVNLYNKTYEEKYSYLKGGGIVKRIVKRDLRAERRAMEEEEERRSRASISRARKSKGTGIKLLVNVVRELIQEVINVASCVSTTMNKSKARAKILERFLTSLKMTMNSRNSRKKKMRKSLKTLKKRMRMTLMPIDPPAGD
ncbi:hypothetical protein PIB30_065441 [Stylosanthes scabra]|uniref:Uncharacterized protein n=1 Tax=Stylosanthes scabra TaxID=79078 RepID=A0ABU6UM09_9FABA|nr:hypothetical protein [Stylosanthes scabra]